MYKINMELGTTSENYIKDWEYLSIMSQLLTICYFHMQGIGIAR